MAVTLIKTVRIGGNYTKAQLSVADWNSTGSPLVLAIGQIAIEKDTLKGKRGDGITAYSALGYVFNEGNDTPKLPPYNPATTYNIDETVRYQIGDTVYQFVSTADGNTTTPSLSLGTKPWDGPIQQDGIDVAYAGVWSSFTTYNKYFYVSKGGHAWESLINGNNNIDPETDGGVNWLDLGVYTGDYNPSTVYNINELAKDTGGLFKSAINGNIYPTSALTINTWILIGENPAKPGIAIDTSVGEQVVAYTGNRLFPDVRFSLPDGHPYTAGWRYESGNVVFEVGVLASDGVVAYVS